MPLPFGRRRLLRVGPDRSLPSPGSPFLDMGCKYAMAFEWAKASGHALVLLLSGSAADSPAFRSAPGELLTSRFVSFQHSGYFWAKATEKTGAAKPAPVFSFFSG